MSALTMTLMILLKMWWLILPVGVISVGEAIMEMRDGLHD